MSVSFHKLSIYPTNNFNLTNKTRTKTHFITNSPVTFTKTTDKFVKSKIVSFGNSVQDASLNYNRQDAEKFIDKIISKEISTKTRGFEGEFFKYGDLGIKVINPLAACSKPYELVEQNNVKEYYILKEINKINPEIAVTPVDLIKKNNKYFLIMDFVKGFHPFDSTINNNQLKDVVQKTYTLDINGIVHNDLQSGNIFLTNNEKTKFIDFGAYNLLTNKGDYLCSEMINAEDVLNSNIKNLHNSFIEGKFLATFYNNTTKDYLPTYSDNPYMNIKSNVSNFEYRMIYDYLSQNKSNEPKKFFSDYLKIKAENYHKPMINFLEKLEISPTDTTQLQQRQDALNTEKIFSKIFSNPSETVMKAELEKIQLKWLINDYLGGKSKAFSYFENFYKRIPDYKEQATESEKAYFDILKKTLEPYRNFLNNDLFKGNELKSEENIIKKLFEKAEKQEVKMAEQTTNVTEVIKKNKSNNKLFIAIVLLSVAGGVLLWLKNKGLLSIQKNHSNNSKL